jgi:hypothetical protein
MDFVICQSHSRGFFASEKIFKSIGPSLWISVAHKTQSYGTNMLLKVVFDKKGVVNLNLVITLNKMLM